MIPKPQVILIHHNQTKAFIENVKDIAEFDTRAIPNNMGLFRYNMLVDIITRHIIWNFNYRLGNRANSNNNNSNIDRCYRLSYTYRGWSGSVTIYNSVKFLRRLGKHVKPSAQAVIQICASSHYCQSKPESLSCHFKGYRITQLLGCGSLFY